tara:strand:- start:97 stop:837 length:741 start_codon:yes stop_codon:yes gene_type:complete
LKSIDNDPLFTRAMVFCAWTGFACVVFFIIGGVILGGMLPPLFNSAEPAAEFARKVSENAFSLRLGSAFMVLSFALFGTVGAGIAAQTRRVEINPVFSIVQTVFGAGGMTIGVLVAFAWGLAAFRPELYEPSIIVTWIDYAYFLALFSVPLFGGWCVVIALPILWSEEGSEPFPRWVAYVNLWAALLYAPGLLIIFFKDGPFSWHGIVALWIPYLAYFGWIMIMSFALLGATRQQGTEPSLRTESA